MAEAEAKTRFLKRLGAKTGSTLRHSMTTKTTVNTAPAAKSAKDCQEAQAKLDPPRDVNKMNDDAAMVRVAIPA